MGYLDWEELDHTLHDRNTGKHFVRIYRTKIPGGWLALFLKWSLSDHEQGLVGGAGLGGLTFVPDPSHEWSGDSLA